jgi:hypothetical protein
MNNRSLWNWTIVLTAALAVVGVAVARLLQAVLPAATLNVIAVVFFTGCVLVIGALVAFFTLRRP